MIVIFGILFVGIFIGLCLNRLFSVRLPNMGRLLSCVVLAMLFCFGASLGCNPDVMGSLHTLGLKGTLLGFAALAGGAVACMFLQKIFTRDTSQVREMKKRNKISLKTLAGSITTLISFVAGILVGKYFGHIIDIHPGSISEWLLYLLVFIVAVGIGNSKSLSTIFNRKNAISLLIPIFSIIGTLVAGVIIGLLPIGFTMGDCVASVSGMGYYSLSSVLINNIKGPEIGVDAAMQLGAIALVGNVVREIFSIVLAPVIYYKMGTYAVIGSCGIPSIDVCLPTITSVCGEDAVAPAVVNGLVLELLTPFLITASCML